MIAVALTLFLAVTSSQATNVVSDAQKKEFVGLLQSLPARGEFFTAQAIDKAGPYLPVLFALTEKDIEKRDIYPFLALGRGLCDRKAHRAYAVRHFAEIRHPVLKLEWATMLFDARATSPEIVQFLRDALESREQSQILAEMLGPNYAGFQRRVMDRCDRPRAVCCARAEEKEEKRFQIKKACYCRFRLPLHLF